MTTQAENLVSLFDRSVWIIDDDIPIQAVDFEHDDMLTGQRSIDRGTLLSLLSKRDAWGDDAVFEICKELVRVTSNVEAFVIPTTAIQQLRMGVKAPDVIIFDMKYQLLPRKDEVLNSLETILSECTSLVQIYTKETLEEANADLEPLNKRLRKRLQEPLRKIDTNASTLTNSLSEYLKISFSAQLATNIRKLSMIAIEKVLVQIDDLPVDVAIRLLAGKEDEFQDVELIELLAAKVSNFISSSNDTADVIKEFGQKLGVPAENEKRFIDETSEIFAIAIKNHIQYDNWIYSTIRSMKQSAQQVASDEETRKIIKNFFAFRIYDQPGDKWVRTGDIISIGPEVDKDGYLFLYLILTPACDLAHFWKKTRGILTLGKLYPLTSSGVAKVKNYNEGKLENTSITARNPFVFPSIAIEGFPPVDYVMFFHEILHKSLPEPTLKPEITAKEKKDFFNKQLTYTDISELKENIQRYCRISEPFLGGILAEVGSLLFRVGVPDFPDEEKERIKNII